MSRGASLLLFILIAVLFLACQKQTNQSRSASPTPNTVTSANGPAGFPSPVLNKPYPGRGVVALINRDEGWIEINHEEIKGLMPAMQMEFNVKDKSLLDRAKVGDHVDFTIVETEKGEYLTELKQVATP